MSNKSAIKQAIMIGCMCFASYLSVYVAKNVLSAVSPEMIEKGILTTENVGRLSSAYFIFYAIGQLINGKIGDIIKSKYMIGFGLVLAGICSMLFLTCINSITVVYISYSLMGFFLSMIFGPMTKTVSENTDSKYTQRCSLGYTFASFLASPIAGILASVMIWSSVFRICSFLLIVMGVVCLVVFSLFEKRGIISHNNIKNKKAKGDVRLLVKNRIIKFMAFAVITGVVRTTIVFWIPTYISQYLGFSPQKSTLIFSVATFAISMTAFLAIFIYERLGRNIDSAILLSFILATILFVVVFLIKLPMVNIICLVIGIMMSNCAASMIWSVYCPTLKKIGMVSTATGLLDFMSYIAAAISSIIFANAVEKIGWSNLILVWIMLMVLGVIISLPFKKYKKHNGV